MLTKIAFVTLRDFDKNDKCFVHAFVHLNACVLIINYKLCCTYMHVQLAFLSLTNQILPQFTAMYQDRYFFEHIALIRIAALRPDCNNMARHRSTIRSLQVSDIHGDCFSFRHVSCNV
jgi:hypothetical protein